MVEAGAPGDAVLREAFRLGWPEVRHCVPKRIAEEARRYLTCGELRCGFVEVTCDGCESRRLLALRCRGRCWCPSCTTRRALETGLHCEAVLPRVPHRQWTLSLPMPLRFRFVKHPRLLKHLERRLVQSVWRLQRAQARRLGVSAKLRGGAVCFRQYFGSSLQLTPHLHLLVPEALWTLSGDEVLLPPPSDADVAAVLARLLRLVQRDWHDDDVWPDDEYEALQVRTLQKPLALALESSHRRRRLAVAHGFSLHADTHVRANDRDGLARLCRYGARGPISASRLSRLDDGRYLYTPKKGVSFSLSAAQLVKRLVALVPPAHSHLTSFHGVFAPHAKLRPLVTLPPAPEPHPAPTPHHHKPRRARIDWATLHQRTFGNDVLTCPHCGGSRKVHALHSTRKAAEARLTELGFSFLSLLLPPQTAPPQLPLAV